MSRQILIALGLFCAVAACTQFPELDAAVSEEAKNAPPPDFRPSDELLAAAARPEAEPDVETDEELAARAAALQARAARLRQQP